MHFYACICAFASDPKLSEEFNYYIKLDQTQSSILKPVTTLLQNNEEDKIVGIGKIASIILNILKFFFSIFS